MEKYKGGGGGGRHKRKSIIGISARISLAHFYAFANKLEDNDRDAVRLNWHSLIRPRGYQLFEYPELLNSRNSLAE